MVVVVGDNDNKTKTVVTIIITIMTEKRGTHPQTHTEALKMIRQRHARERPCNSAVGANERKFARRLRSIASEGERTRERKKIFDLLPFPANFSLIAWAVFPLSLREMLLKRARAEARKSFIVRPRESERRLFFRGRPGKIDACSGDSRWRRERGEFSVCLVLEIGFGVC